MDTLVVVGASQSYPEIGIVGSLFDGPLEDIGRDEKQSLFEGDIAKSAQRRKPVGTPFEGRDVFKTGLGGRPAMVENIGQGEMSGGRFGIEFKRAAGGGFGVPP